MKTYEIQGQKIGADDLWLGVFGSGASQFTWWQSFAFAKGDPDRAGHALVTGRLWSEGGWDYAVRAWITADDLARAAELVLGQYVQTLTRRPFELDNLDADAADVILQQAVFGEVIYG